MWIRLPRITPLVRVTAIALLLVGGRAQSQRAPSSLDASRRALALIDSALERHGGAQRLRSLDDVTLRSHGQRWMEWQSTSLRRPWVTQPTFTETILDFRRDRVAVRRINRYPLDFAFVGNQVITPQGNLLWDSTRAGLGDGIRRLNGFPAAQNAARRELPALQILQARNRAETVRWLGERVVGGRRQQGVSYAESNGAVYELWFDSGTKHLASVEWLRDHPVDGDQLAVYEYSRYRVEKGIPVPGRLVERSNGEIVRDDTLTIAIDSHPADALFQLPLSGFADPAPPAPPQGPESEAVRQLADNVWLLQQLPSSNRVMFVAFRDYVLVLEAPTPQSVATAVLDAVRRTVPGKPVRYVAFSHHHDDHAGGLRPYIAEGITIVTTPAARPFVEHVASARHTLRPDELSSAPRAPVIETFSTKRVFTDGDMVVELHDIGPTSHVDEIVLAWLPRQKIVFQGDLLILPFRGEPGPANTLTVEFLRAVERLGLDAQTIAGVHGPVGTIDDLRKSVARRTR